MKEMKIVSFWILLKWGCGGWGGGREETDLCLFVAEKRGILTSVHLWLKKEGYLKNVQTVLHLSSEKNTLFNHLCV